MSKLFLIGLIALIIINLISTLIIANIKKNNTKEKNALYSCLVSIGIITLLFLIDTIASDNGSFKNFVVGCLSSIFYEVIFYPINLLTITINNKLRTKKKSENKKTKVKGTIQTSVLLSIVIPITIVLCIGIVMFFDYRKEQLKQEKEDKRLESEQKADETRQEQLNICIVQAKNNRTILWNSNCTNQSNGSCTINSNSGIVEWIEQKYQQDLDNCYQLYGN